MSSSPKLARGDTKVGVQISKETGGAFADVREVIESEIARIRGEQPAKAADNGSNRQCDLPSDKRNGDKPR